MSKKPKMVLMIDHHPLPAGGMEVHAYGIYKALKRQDEIELGAVVGFSSGKEGLNYIDEVIVLPKKSIFQPGSVYKIIKKLKLERGDVLFFNSLYWIRIIPELKKKFPEITFLLRSGGNDIAQSEIIGEGETLKERRSFVINTVNKYVDFLIANSGYSYHKLERFGLKKSRMAIVTGGVDTETFKPVSNSRKIELRKKFGLPLNKVIILSSCRLVRFKGVDQVLKAISQSSIKDSIHYLLVGDGPEKERLTRLVRDLQIENSVTMVGEVPMESVHQYYQLSDIYCHTPVLTKNFVQGGSYIHTETMGRSFCEAMSAGLPVISSNVGGVSDVVKNENGGVLVKSKNVPSLKKEIESLTLDKSNREEKGLLARKAANHFSWEEVLNSYYSLIKSKNDK